MARPSSPTPAIVATALRRIGADLQAWRKLRGLTIAQVADRAGISAQTVAKLEAGNSVALEHFLRVARALGVLEQVVATTDPYATELGRLRSEEALPERVRTRRRS
jgi:transcriptional regulator with XRE-family HTH domain